MHEQRFFGQNAHTCDKKWIGKNKFSQIFINMNILNAKYAYASHLNLFTLLYLKYFAFKREKKLKFTFINVTNYLLQGLGDHLT